MDLSDRPAPTRAILPDDVRAFYAEARARTYAAGAPALPNPLIPGSKEIRYEAPPYCYHDRYVDDQARPGNFFGLEVVNRGGYDGPVLASCSYGGGLTDEGLRLTTDAALGQVLQDVLREYAIRVRFGEVLRVERRTGAGLWLYVDDGEVVPWGWLGTERIWLDGVLVYSLGYQGGCLIPGY